MAVAPLRQMYIEGTRRWPQVALAFDVFEAHCATLLDRPHESDVAGTDLFLCCACARGDGKALQAFQREALPVAHAAIANIRRDPDFVQDALQELWTKLLFAPAPKVAKFAGRGPLQAWVRVSATRSALDRCRKLALVATREAELTDHFAALEPSVERLLSRARYGDAFQSAIREAIASLPPRDRNALRMHVSGRCSIDEIGRAYGVHRATAARWLERTRLAIGQGVRAALGRRQLKLTDSEFRSLASAMASGLELGLSGTFEQAPELSQPVH